MIALREMSQDVSPSNTTINPLSLSSPSVDSNGIDLSEKSTVTSISVDSTAPVIGEDRILCEGVLLPEFIINSKLVKKIRVDAKPLTEFSRMVLGVRYIAMFIGRVLAIVAICVVDESTESCKKIVAQDDGNDTTAPSECRGIVVTLVILSCFLSSMNDAVWATSFVGVKSGSEYRFPRPVEVWLQCEVVLGMMSLYLWYHLFYPFIMFLKGLLAICCIRKLGKVWVSLTIISFVSAILSLVCFLMNVISDITSTAVEVSKGILFIVSVMSFLFSLTKLICYRSKMICWFSTEPPVPPVVARKSVSR